jgi:hypothetical protein
VIFCGIQLRTILIESGSRESGIGNWELGIGSRVGTSCACKSLYARKRQLCPLVNGMMKCVRSLRIFPGSLLRRLYGLPEADALLLDAGHDFGTKLQGTVWELVCLDGLIKTLA